MADIKTTLRELSVATTLGLLIRNKHFSQTDFYDLNKFLHYATYVTTDAESAKTLIKSATPTDEIRKIMDNGYNLGKAIYENSHFSFLPSDAIRWLGGDTQKSDPTDVAVGKYSFSLKEESFILENMGLYKLINLFTGSNRKRGTHLFLEYAPNEYSQWFNATLKEVVNCLHTCGDAWKYENPVKGYTSFLTISDGIITAELQYIGKAPIRSTFSENSTVFEFNKNTCSKTREEVFSKFINAKLSKNNAYNAAKKICAIAACRRLVNELNANLNYKEGMPRFLRMHKFEYYYAKTTASGTKIYRVPPISEFENNIEIESITASVPDSQANILTSIVNRKTGKKLIFRNECRFSHGQFNGAPEAKLYYEQGSSLLTIYECMD